MLLTLWWIANILCKEVHQYWKLSCQGTTAILMFWGLLRNSFLKTTAVTMMVSVKEVQSVVVWGAGLLQCGGDMILVVVTMTQYLECCPYLCGSPLEQPCNPLWQLCKHQLHETKQSASSTHTQLLKSSLKQYYTIYFYYLFIYLTWKAPINQR